MTLSKMTVCSSEGRTEEYVLSADGSDIETHDLTGKIKVKLDNPFVFYAVESISPGAVAFTLKNGSRKTINNGQLAQTPLDVVIAMPLGGTESGLFRQPRVGEEVLVVQEENVGNYLMGYVPHVKEGEGGFSADNAAGNMAQEEPRTHLPAKNRKPDFQRTRARITGIKRPNNKEHRFWGTVWTGAALRKNGSVRPGNHPQVRRSPFN